MYRHYVSICADSHPNTDDVTMGRKRSRPATLRIKFGTLPEMIGSPTRIPYLRFDHLPVLEVHDLCAKVYTYCYPNAGIEFVTHITQEYYRKSLMRRNKMGLCCVARTTPRTRNYFGVRYQSKGTYDFPTRESPVITIWKENVRRPQRFKCGDS